MKDNKSKGSCNEGFTLIELLIVVLIIGILAAVAVPQYQIAVAKARLTQLITYATTIKEAQEVYYLANGEYADSLDQLDISVESKPDEMNIEFSSIKESNGGSGNAVLVSDTRLPGIRFYIYYAHADDNPDGAYWNDSNKRYLWCSNERAYKICRAVTGKGNTNGDVTNKRYVF